MKEKTLIDLFFFLLELKYDNLFQTKGEFL